MTAERLKLEQERVKLQTARLGLLGVVLFIAYEALKVIA